MRLREYLENKWNAFINAEKDPLGQNRYLETGAAIYGGRPDRHRYSSFNDRTIITAIYNRIAMDAAAITIRHVLLNEDGLYESTVKSRLNRCLTLEANIDQGATHFRQDIFSTLIDKGSVAIVAVDTDEDPEDGSYDILSLRVGEVVGWYPSHVKVRAYNERKGHSEEVLFDKANVAIVENPFYAIMNEHNSTLQRLIRTLKQIDIVSEAASSGKLDIIIQLPYIVKGETKQKAADQRLASIQQQLTENKYGIAYVDGTERITQLNRPSENNLLTQAQFLKEMLYEQLGINTSIMDGTASEAAMLNYNSRVIKPLITAVIEAMNRSFITDNARTRGHAIDWFSDPFQLVPIGQIAEIADKFTRNEIMSSNEIRSGIGYIPSKDPKANELRNANMPDPNAGGEGGVSDTGEADAMLDDMDSYLDGLLTRLREAGE